MRSDRFHDDGAQAVLEWMTPVAEAVVKFNPNHEPAGSSIGGQFASGDGGGGNAPWHQSLVEFAGEYPPFDPGASKEEEDRALQVAQAYRDKKRAWEISVQAAISEGKLDPAEAQRRGLDQPKAKDWQPLPPDLYHATTAKDAVLADQLRSRAELGQSSGLGLGGGDDATISFTDDPAVADEIYQSLHEARRVATGELSLQDLLDRAEKGTGADRPYLQAVIRGGSAWIAGNSNWTPGDPLPDGWKLALEERTRVNDMGVRADEIPPEGRPLDEGWMGGDGIRRYLGYSMPMTADEARSSRFEAYKAWATHRETAGGPMNPVFFLSNEHALAKVKPDQIAVLHVQPKPGAMGTRTPGLSEWRTYSGRAVRVTGTTQPDRRKGYPEFNPDQARDTHGQWAGGGGQPPGDPLEWTPEQRRGWLDSMAKEAGIDPAKVELVNEDLASTVPGDAQGSKIMANARWDLGVLQFRPAFFQYTMAENARPIFAHEALHLRYHAVAEALSKEKERLHEHEVGVGPNDALAHEQPNGFLKPEVYGQYPVIARLERSGLQDLHGIAADASNLSAYAKTWSTAWNNGNALTTNWLTEVISEVAYARAKGRDYYKRVTTKRLRDLYRAWNDAYEQDVAPKRA